MLNFIPTAEDRIVDESSVSEALATLQSLVDQLEVADDLEAELNTSSESIAYKAFTEGGTAKSNLERLEKDISAVQTKQRMLRVAITQGEVILSKARAKEANETARAQAEEARSVAADMAALGESLDNSLNAFILGYKEYQEEADHLDRLGYRVYNTLDKVILTRLMTTLQLARIMQRFDGYGALGAALV
jgi:hypothetical protein